MAADVQASQVGAQPPNKVDAFVGFAVVGASGLVVNQVALWFLTSKVGVYYLLSAVVATQISTIWNFALVERFVFDGGHEGRWARLGWFALMNNIWLLLRTPVPLRVDDGCRPQLPDLERARVSGAMTLVRFGIADNLIWADRSGSARRVRPARRHAHLELRHPRHRCDHLGVEASRARAVPGAGAARSGRHRGRRQQRGLRWAPPHDRRHRGGLNGLLRRAPRAARVRHEDRCRHPGAHPGVEAVASLAPRCVHERGRAGRSVGHGAQGLHPRARGLPADRRSRRADHGADRHGQDHHVPEVDQGTGHRVRVRRHGDHRSSGQRAVLSRSR